MTRVLASVALALGLLISPATGPAAAGGHRPAARVVQSIPQGAITWKVNHISKMITVSVKLQIYARGSDSAAAGKIRAAQITADILSIWNNDYKYRCYSLNFDVDITLTTDRFHIDNDRVGIRIDDSPVEIRSKTMYVGSRKGLWDSDDPSDKVVPINDPVVPTTWSAFAPARTYAHEFGHIIGLNDGYEEKYDAATDTDYVVPRPGAPIDLMSAYSNDVAQATIDRLIARSPVDRSTLKCDYTVVGSFREPNSSQVCGGAVSALVEDRVTASLIWTKAGYHVTDIKNLPTTYAPPKLPVPVPNVSVKIAAGPDSDPDILLANDGSVSLADDMGVFSVRLTGDIHVGSCTFIDTKRGTSKTLDPGGTEPTEVSFEFARDKFSGGKQTVRPAAYDFWTWVVTEK